MVTVRGTRTSVVSVAVLLLFIDLVLFSTPTLAQQTKPSGIVRDEFSANCSHNLTSGYSETPVTHAVDIDLSGILEGNHNLTMILNTSEKLRWIHPLVGVEGLPASFSSEGKIVIAANVSGQECWLRIVLNETTEFADPLNVTFSPSWKETFPMDEIGHLGLGFWLNTSEFLNSCTFRLKPRNDAKIQQLEVITDLSVEDTECYSYSGEAFFSVGNVTRGNYQIGLDLRIGGTLGQLDLEVTTTQENLSMPIICYLDNELLTIREVRVCSYAWNGIGFALMKDQFYYYSDDQAFCLNFTAPRNFILRIDATSREEIDYVIADTYPDDFSVVPLSILDEPCYEFTFTTKSDFDCCLGLRIKEKRWFVSPENLSLDAIPPSVRNQYLNPSSSYDGSLFDVKDTFVMQWADELTKNETNPYTIASLIFANVTRTINSTMESNMYEQYSFNEDVSSILRDRIGVCRHKARAFVALSICSGLPARTVVGTLFEQMNETWKKNHEWVEVYFPNCGWVSIDPTWEQYLYLSNKHRQSTLWNHIEGTLNVNIAETAFRNKAKESSASFIQHLISQCKNMASGESRLSPHAALLLDEASALGARGSIHDALIAIAQAYLIITNAPAASPVAIETLSVIVLGLAILTITTLFGLAKTPENLLKKEEELDISSDEERKKRRMEYKALTDIVRTRENSTVVVGSIISSASFLILSLGFGLGLASKFIAVIGAILLEGAWLIYYESTGKLDNVSYDLVRKLERRIGIDVHGYLLRCRQKSGQIRARSYLWKAVFVLVWILGISVVLA